MHTHTNAGVRLMIDAEQTYFQEAIDNIVIDLQVQHKQTHTPLGPLPAF